MREGTETGQPRIARTAQVLFLVVRRRLSVRDAAAATARGGSRRHGNRRDPGERPAPLREPSAPGDRAASMGPGTSSPRRGTGCGAAALVHRRGHASASRRRPGRDCPNARVLSRLCPRSHTWKDPACAALRGAGGACGCRDAGVQTRRSAEYSRRRAKCLRSAKTPMRTCVGSIEGIETCQAAGEVAMRKWNGVREDWVAVGFLCDDKAPPGDDL